MLKIDLNISSLFDDVSRDNIPNIINQLANISNMEFELDSKHIFKPEQVAIGCANKFVQEFMASRLNYIYKDSGAWIKDVVTAYGDVHYDSGVLNWARLWYNYGIIPGKELELITYLDGANFLHRGENLPFISSGFCFSHLGAHVTEDELLSWKNAFKDIGISPLQEVITLAHTNPAVKDIKRYHYCIFNTFDEYGVLIKLIARRVIQMQ